ncbi:MAG: hypothetical protein JXA90_12940 [Planctomycetes bacterium]|nr:hypothetical protein [Planctomycetota bacterium]
MHVEEISLLIQEAGDEKARLVRVRRWPFTLADSPAADVVVRRTSAPVSIRFDREGDRFVARNLLSGRDDEAGPGFPLKHGTRIRTGGLQVRFLTRPPLSRPRAAGAEPAPRPESADGAIPLDPVALSGLAERVRSYLDRVERLRERLGEPPEFLRRT